MRTNIGYQEGFPTYPVVCNTMGVISHKLGARSVKTQVIVIILMTAARHFLISRAYQVIRSGVGNN